MTIQMSDQTDSTITRTVMALAAAQGMKLDDLADQAGITRSTFYRRTTQGKWTATEVARLALRLGYPVNDLYTGLEGRLSTRDRDTQITHEYHSVSGSNSYGNSGTLHPALSESSRTVADLVAA